MNQVPASFNPLIIALLAFLPGLARGRPERDELAAAVAAAALDDDPPWQWPPEAMEAWRLACHILADRLPELPQGAIACATRADWSNRPAAIHRHAA